MNETLQTLGYWPVQIVPHDQIEENNLTNFSLSPALKELEQSILDIGVTNPIVLSPSKTLKKQFRLVCGHRRIQILKSQNIQTFPARISPQPLDDLKQLELNLLENFGHRSYTDIEKGLILIKCSCTGANEKLLIEKFLPLVGLESSKKLAKNFLKIDLILPSIRLLLHQLNYPLRAFSVLFNWNEKGQEAIENLFSILRPGVNKGREILEMVDEICKRDQTTPEKILLSENIPSTLNDENIPLNEKYNSFHNFIKQIRYPTLTDLQQQVWKAIDDLKLDDSIKLRFPENFESNRLKMEIKFSTPQELLKYAEQLFRASDSKTLENLIKIFKNLK